MHDLHLQRAEHLLSQGRSDLARQELRMALTLEPNSAQAHALLALCEREQRNWKEATESAETAIGLSPDTPFYHYVLGEVLLARKRYKQARECFERVLQMDPEDANYWSRKGALELLDKQWSAALEAADRALGIDAEHVDAGNIRATALNFMGRHDESRQAAQDTLRRAPDDADSHASTGWTCLHRGDAKAAVEHFREALRLEPENDWARRGIAEALKAQNFLYRALLRYFLFMARLPARVQFGLIIGLLVLVRITASIGESNPRLEPFLQPIVYLYVIFVVISWCGDSFANLILRLHPLGRHALDSDEKRGATAVGLTLFGGIGCFGAGFLLDHAAIVWLGIHLFFMVLPVSAVFKCEIGWPRWAMLTIALALLATVAWGFLNLLQVGDPGPLAQQALLGIALSTWAAGALGSVELRH